MSALTANNPGVITNPGPFIEMPVAGSTHIYQGARVCINSSGYLVPAADTSGFKYAGIAMAEVNNTGSNGAVTCAVAGPGNTGYDNIHTTTIASTATQGTVGVHTFLVDDQTVDIAANSTNKVSYGLCVLFISATTILVDTSQRFTIIAAA